MAKLTVRMQRDLRGQVVSVGTAEAPERFARYDYRADGGIASETLGAGTVARSFAYDPAGRLTRLDDPAFSVALGYRVDGKPTGPYADGGVTAETTTWKPSAFAAGKAPGEAGRTYAFDKFGRLSDTKSSLKTQALAQSYDADGNILSRAPGGAGASAYTYGAGTNQLAQVKPLQGAALPLAHDAAGAVSAVGALALRHDGPGDLASRVRTPSAALAYQAGPDGERVLKTVSGEGALKRLTVRSGAATLMEVDQAGHTETYVRGPTGPVVLITEDADHPLSDDQRGSLRVAWTAGKAEAAFDYLPFGALDEANSLLPAPFAARLRRRYTGQEWEAETGLYNYHARLYDPKIARFLSTDPAGQGASPYAYVGGDPVDYVDPTGWMRTISGILIFRLNKKYTRYILLDEAKYPILGIDVHGNINDFRVKLKEHIDIYNQTASSAEFIDMSPHQRGWLTHGGGNAFNIKAPLSDPGLQAQYGSGPYAKKFANKVKSGLRLHFFNAHAEKVSSGAKKTISGSRIASPTSGAFKRQNFANKPKQLSRTKTNFDLPFRGDPGEWTPTTPSPQQGWDRFLEMLRAPSEDPVERKSPSRRRNEYGSNSRRGYDWSSSEDDSYDSFTLIEPGPPPRRDMS